jgi:hypothetical protein
VSFRNGNNYTNNLIWERIGSEVEVVYLMAQECIANGTANQSQLEAGIGKSCRQA